MRAALIYSYRSMRIVQLKGGRLWCTFVQPLFLLANSIAKSLKLDVGSLKTFEDREIEQS